MDVMCTIGYNTKAAYFSIKCAQALGYIMKNYCPTLSNTTEFNKIVCSKKVPCEHFVCAVPNGVKVQGALYFGGRKRVELCLIPKKNNRKGLTSKASMYTNCGFDPKYPKFCHNLECTNSSSVLKNCDNYTCVKFRSQIDPNSGISRYLNTGTFIFSSENENDQFLQHTSKATISVIISIPVILLLSILILLKRNWLF
ncbi:hypothetical protein HZS_4859 [Henneguya salminicola]|nr:hypothetical protein HZS_4859 [Henneguya salminicola]